MTWMTENTLMLTMMIVLGYFVYDGQAINNCLTEANRKLTDEQRLLSSLMVDYNRKTRPVFNASHSVDIFVGITLTQIFDVDEKNQVLTTNIWLDQEWYDQKLHWDPDHYNGLKTLRIPCKLLWLPDIVLYNSADDYTRGYMEALAMVRYDGHVFWPPIVNLRSTCQIDITYFPFDDQVCKLKLGSWAYDGLQVNVFNRSTPVDLSSYVANGEWDLVNVTAIRNVIWYPCCPESFPDVTFTIHITRKTLYYTYNVIIPCMMLSLLALLGFWLHPLCGEKVTMGLTVLLALSVFMLLIAENTPATSSFVPLIGIYLTTIMSFTSLSVVLAVIVSNVHARGTKVSPLPKCFKRLVIFLANIVFIRVQFIHLEDDIDKSNSSITLVCNSETKDCIMKKSNPNGTIGHFSSARQLERMKDKLEQSENNTTDKIDRNTETTAAVMSALQYLIDKDRAYDIRERHSKQWAEASEIIDRFFFWLFVLGNIMSSLILLVFFPLTKTPTQM